MGIFVVVAALLTKIFSLVPSLVSYAYLNWYFREASVSVYVANLPPIWALVRDIFPTVRYWGYPSRTYSDGFSSNRKTYPPNSGGNRSHNIENDLGDDLELFHRLGSVHSKEEPDLVIQSHTRRDFNPI
jgi:hypothetical protein